MTQAEKLVSVALGERGAKGGSEYVRWYNAETGAGLPLSSAWCAIFVSWCARKAGLSQEALPTFISCTAGRALFKSKGTWRSRDKGMPKAGDLILFDWDGDPTFSEHVGIVTGADASKVYTVEGNSGGTVREKVYPRASAKILGFAAWAKEETDMSREELDKLVRERVAEAVAAVTPKRYKTLNDVPLSYQGAVRRLMEAKALTGREDPDPTRLDDNILDLSDDYCRIMSTLDKLGVLK